MGLKPRARAAKPVLVDPRIALLRPVIPTPEERGTKRRVSTNSEPDWKVVLEGLAPEVRLVHENRGLAVDTNLWFYQVGHPQLGHLPFKGMQTLRAVGLDSLRITLQAFDASQEEVLILTGKMLARLLSSNSPVYRSPRSWFGSSKIT